MYLTNYSHTSNQILKLLIHCWEQQRLVCPDFGLFLTELATLSGYLGGISPLSGVMTIACPGHVNSNLPTDRVKKSV